MKKHPYLLLALLTLTPILSSHTKGHQQKRDKWVHLLIQNPKRNIRTVTNQSCSLAFQKNCTITQLEKYTTSLYNISSPLLQNYFKPTCPMLTGMWINYQQAKKNSAYSNPINKQLFNIIESHFLAHLHLNELCLNITSHHNTPEYCLILDMTQSLHNKERFSLLLKHHHTWFKALDLDALGKPKKGLTSFHAVSSINLLASSFQHNIIVLNLPINAILASYPQSTSAKNYFAQKTHITDLGNKQEHYNINMTPYPHTQSYHQFIFKRFQCKTPNLHIHLPHFNTNTKVASLKNELQKKVNPHLPNHHRITHKNIKIFLQKAHEHHELPPEENLHKLINKLSLSKTILLTLFYSYHICPSTTSTPLGYPS